MEVDTFSQTPLPQTIQSRRQSWLDSISDSNRRLSLPRVSSFNSKPSASYSQQSNQRHSEGVTPTSRLSSEASGGQKVLRPQSSPAVISSRNSWIQSEQLFKVARQMTVVGEQGSGKGNTAAPLIPRPSFRKNRTDVFDESRHYVVSEQTSSRKEDLAHIL